MLDGPITAIRESLRASLPLALLEVRNASGKRSAAALRARLRTNGTLKAAADVESGGFDETDPAAVEWIQEHAAELVDGISDTARQKIRDLIEAAFTEQFDVDDLADQIADVIGDENKAEEIAITETMEASNEGQREAWDDAVDDGLLTGNEQREWIVADDDRLCPICEPMDGEVADLDGTFRVDGDEIDGPPAHPRCRCTEGLVV